MNREFTLVEFFAWVREQPSDELLNYCNPFECPIARFVKETGRYVRPVVCSDIMERDERGEDVQGTRTSLPSGLDMLIASCSPYTYGQLALDLERRIARLKSEGSHIGEVIV